MKKALLIGINKYHNSAWNLEGCVNDALDIKDLLENTYEFNEIKTLLDFEATRENILEELKKLVTSLKENDVGVFYNSSHGSQVPDKYPFDEADGLEEILIPSDHSWDNPLTDDNIHEIVQLLHKNARLYIVFDCCHSGSATKALLFNPLGSILLTHIYPNSMIRYIHPPFEFKDLKRKGFFSYLKELIFGEEKKIEDTENMNHLFMSSCEDNQTSLEVNINGIRRGVFTYYLTKYLREGNNKNKSIISIHNSISELLKSNGYNQIAKLEGPIYLKNGMLFA